MHPAKMLAMDLHTPAQIPMLAHASIHPLSVQEHKERNPLECVPTLQLNPSGTLISQVLYPHPFRRCVCVCVCVCVSVCLCVCVRRTVGSPQVYLIPAKKPLCQMTVR